MNKNRYLLAGIMLLGLALRLLFAEGRSIQYDDAFSIFLAQQSLANIISGTAADTMPPLYYFLLHFWLLVSEQLWWLRLLSTLFSLGSILFLYAWVKDLFDAPSALWAALLAAISPFQIYHAQDLRMYALLAFSQMGYAWFFSRLWLGRGTGGKDGWGNWAGLVGCGTVAMYTHNLAIFVLLVPDLFLVLRREGRLLRNLLLAQLGMAVLSLPWLLMVPGQLAKIQTAFWTPRPGLVEILQAVVVFTTNLPLPGVWLAVGVVLSFQILVLVILENWRIRSKRAAQACLTAFALLPPVLLFAASFLMRPVFVPRGFVVSSLAYYGLAGYAIHQRWKGGAGTLLAISFLLAAGVGLPYQYLYDGFPRSPYQQAVQFIQGRIAVGERVVHDNKLSYFPSRYYAPDLPQVFLADEAGSPNDTLALQTQQAMNIFPEPDLAEAIKDQKGIFFVVFTRTIQEYQQMGYADHPQLAWLENHSSQWEKWQFNDLDVYYFGHLAP
ncbi:MAG: hypothetical protein GYA59_10700 [Chloroflexi bacterium]|nr:hypothetical protein [Chloroflexota bacterium]